MIKSTMRGVGVAFFAMLLWFWSEFDLYLVVLTQAIVAGGFDLFSTILWQEMSLNWWRILGIILSLVLIFFLKIDETQIKK